MCLYTWRTKSVKLQITAYVAPIFLNRTFFIFLQCLNPEKKCQKCKFHTFLRCFEVKIWISFTKIEISDFATKAQFWT